MSKDWNNFELYGNYYYVNGLKSILIIKMSLINFNTNIVFIWKLIFEQDSPDVLYLQVNINIVVDEISQSRNNGNQKTTQ